MKIEICDVSPRDGDQAAGVNLSVDDKIWFLEVADQLGLDFVEVGFPISNDIDKKVAQKLSDYSFRKTTALSFGMTHSKDKAPDEDAGLAGLAAQSFGAVSLVGKSSLLQVDKCFGISGKRNLQLVRGSIEFLVQHGRQVLFDAEHFFDGYGQNPKYAMKVLETAAKSCASHLILCDTNGGSTPELIGAAVREVCRRFSDLTIGVHLHNDRGLAVANMRAAVCEGATHVQGTWNGFGERAGNLCLVEAIANLSMDGFKTLSKKKLRRLSDISRRAATRTMLQQPRGKPFVGRSAFTHKGGLHVSAVRKDSSLYEFISPAKFGNTRRLVGSKQAGRAMMEQVVETTLLLDERVRKLLLKNAGFLSRSLERVKRKEAAGIDFSLASASLELEVLGTDGVLVRKIRCLSPPKLVDKIGDETEVSISIGAGRGYPIPQSAVGKGEGPIDAIANTLLEGMRGEMGGSSEKPDLQLISFEQHAMTGAGEGAKSIVHVLAEFSDGENVWATSGASRDSFEAGWQSIVDGFEYKLALDDACDVSH